MFVLCDKGQNFFCKMKSFFRQEVYKAAYTRGVISTIVENDDQFYLTVLPDAVLHMGRQGTIVIVTLKRRASSC